MSKVTAPKYEFAEIRCANKTKHDLTCTRYLGDVEVSRPNISRKRCDRCGIIWQITVTADGAITQEVSTIKQITSKTIPISVLRYGPYKPNERVR